MEINIDSGGLAGVLTVEVNQEATENRSKLRITGIQLRTKDGGTIGACYITGTITIDGGAAAEFALTGTQTCGIFLSGTLSGGTEDTWTGMKTIQVTAVHDAAGKKAVEIKLALTATTTSGTVATWLAQTIQQELPVIARSAGITAENGVLGEEMVIGITGGVESYRYRLGWKCGSRSGTAVDGASGASIRWVPPLDIAEAAPSAERVEVQLTLVTVSDGQDIGSSETAVQLRIPESVKPEVTVSLEDTTELFAQYGGYVQGKSIIAVHTEAVGAYGASVRKITVAWGDKTAEGSDCEIIPESSGELAITVTAADSRGREQAVTRTIQVLAYREPYVDITELHRCNDDGERDPEGDHARIEFRAAASGLTEMVRYSILRVSTETEDEFALADYDDLTAIGRGSAIIEADTEEDYRICLRARDGISTAEAWRTLRWNRGITEMGGTSVALSCDGASARVKVTGLITAGMVGVGVKIHCDEAWDGLIKSLIVMTAEDKKVIPLVEDSAVLPWELLVEGLHLYLSLEGRDSEGRLVMPSAWADCGRIRPSGERWHEDIEPTPSEIEMLLMRTGYSDLAAKEAAERAAAAAAAAQKSVSEGKYVIFNIEEDGHLYMEKVGDPDIDFELEAGRLVAIYDA